MSEVLKDLGEGKGSFGLRRNGVFKSIHDALQATALARRCTSRPMASQTPSAIHSAALKWPGTAGTSFIRISRVDTVIPNKAIDRNPVRDSIIKNEKHAANQPNAAAMEPTSV